MSLSKRQWISQDVIDYLMGLPPTFQIFYEVRTTKKHLTSFLFRDGEGKMVADLYAENVESVAILYQGDWYDKRYFVHGRLDGSSLPRLKNVLQEHISKFPATQSKVQLNALSSMQAKLRDVIEDATKVIGYHPEEDDKDYVLNFGALPPDAKRRVADFIIRLDKECVPVTLTVSLRGVTEEQIGATLDEIAMYEMERDERENQDDEGDTDEGEDA